MTEKTYKIGYVTARGQFLDAPVHAWLVNHCEDVSAFLREHFSINLSSPTNILTSPLALAAWLILHGCDIESKGSYVDYAVRSDVAGENLAKWFDRTVMEAQGTL